LDQLLEVCVWALCRFFVVGVSQIGQTAIIAPSGEIVTRSSALGRELVVYRCDLDLVKPHKERLFNFAKHRRIEHYGLIATQTGVVLPPE
jgi:N-carbamoyl-D-amino-acid hydrolase